MDDSVALRKELVGLFSHIQRIRTEIAAIRKPGDAGGDKFVRMADELDAIVEATEEATNIIMESVEQINALLVEVRPAVTDAKANETLDRIDEKIQSVFEACAFQDITGQRVTKVVRLIKYVEERVNALIAIWGAPQLATVDVHEEKKGEYDKYLNGPQLKGKGVSQLDIDALLTGGQQMKGGEQTNAKPGPAAAPSAPPHATTRNQRHRRPTRRSFPRMTSTNYSVSPKVLAERACHKTIRDGWTRTSSRESGSRRYRRKTTGRIA
ncbi:MAG: hypothetical protein FD149_1698 [Rhodospirillaceae bacterium]|nr:MAG: hypothetical protein FD149_1698 [Rhodospirillaceae bacterium]